MKATNADVVFFDAKLKQEREFWLRKLAAELVTSGPLPDYQRPHEQTQQRDRLSIEVAADVRRQLRALVGSSSFLLYTALMAALKVCLYKYTRNDNVLVGSPALKELGRANALTISDQLNDEQSFRQLLLVVRATLLEAYGQQRYPVSRLIKDLNLSDVQHKCPLFDISLALDGMHGELPDVGQDIAITFTDAADVLTAEVSYNPTVHAPETVRRFIAHYLNVLRDGVTTTEKRVRELQLMTEAERREMLVDWNQTAAELPERLPARVGRSTSCADAGCDCRYL